MARGLTEDERALMQHVSRWGSDGYPVQKCGSRHWSWGEFLSVKGPPVVFKTSAYAVASAVSRAHGRGSLCTARRRT